MQEQDTRDILGQQTAEDRAAPLPGKGKSAATPPPSSQDDGEAVEPSGQLPTGE